MRLGLLVRCAGSVLYRHPLVAGTTATALVDRSRHQILVVVVVAAAAVAAAAAALGWRKRCLGLHFVVWHSLCFASAAYALGHVECCCLLVLGLVVFIRKARLGCHSGHPPSPLTLGMACLRLERDKALLHCAYPETDAVWGFFVVVVVVFVLCLLRTRLCPPSFQFSHAHLHHHL